MPAKTCRTTFNDMSPTCRVINLTITLYALYNSLLTRNACVPALDSAKVLTHSASAFDLDWISVLVQERGTPGPGSIEIRD